MRGEAELRQSARFFRVLEERRPVSAQHAVQHRVLGSPPRIAVGARSVSKSGTSSGNGGHGRSSAQRSDECVPMPDLSRVQRSNSSARACRCLSRDVLERADCLRLTRRERAHRRVCLPLPVARCPPPRRLPPTHPARTRAPSRLPAPASRMMCSTSPAMPSSDQHLLHAREERADFTISSVAPQRRRSFDFAVADPSAGLSGASRFAQDERKSAVHRTSAAE